MRELGACWHEGTTTFRVWAPDHHRVDLVIHGTREDEAWRLRPLVREADGYWCARASDAPPGTLYRYRLNGSDAQVFPDPASRFQPAGVHGPSQVVDPLAFHWSDAGWQPPSLERLVIYELHVGTFSPDGTYRGAARLLTELARLGVTAIELMPLADFPGERNWGYDGVALFAPARCYGTPDDLRWLVNAAHALGLAVIVDVVYNHLGPDGAYANAFSSHYFTRAHRNPWGDGINLDGPHSRAVRDFLIANARMWVGEYHADGLRLDATHQLRDDSRPHFLSELSGTLRSETERPILLIAEDERNLAPLLRRRVGAAAPAADDFGMDAVWSDDFHHQVRVHLAGDRDSYFADFSGSTDDIAQTLRHGWFFVGQRSAVRGQPRGSDPAGLEPSQFVICTQNHDQVGNRPDGARLHHQVDLAAYRAACVLLLLAPHVPLLFMGQEWAASTPFQFFTDHHDELGRLVTAGRREEFATFAAFATPARRAVIPDPQARATFERSRLRWEEREEPPHAGILRLHQRLLSLRALHPALQPHPRRDFDVRSLDAHTLALTRRAGEDGLLAVIRLSSAGFVRLPPNAGRVVLTTEDADVAADPIPLAVADGQLEFARPGAVIAELAGHRIAGSPGSGS